MSGDQQNEVRHPPEVIAAAEACHDYLKRLRDMAPPPGLDANTHVESLCVDLASPRPAPGGLGLLTIWYHGGMSYSLDGLCPVLVSKEQHFVLKSFLDSDEARGTKQLEMAVPNVSDVIGKIVKTFGKTAVRQPHRKKGSGYFIRVRSLKQD
jgi:hypothetical protein